MGMIQSIFCSIVFCAERVMTWLCCAFLIMMMLFCVIMLMIYGISVGYHYAQKELASFASSSRSPSEQTRRSGSDTPVVRLVAVNRSEVENVPPPVFEAYQSRKSGEQVYIETSPTPFVFLETERSPARPELSPQERDLARRLISRFRRSRNTTTNPPFYRPLNSSEPIPLIHAT